MTKAVSKGMMRMNAAAKQERQLKLQGRKQESASVEVMVNHLTLSLGRGSMFNKV